MSYRFETERKDYRDFASGHVLYHATNATAFPVRLASEIAQRSFALLREQGCVGPYKIYDPCCGSAYLLTIIGFLHRSFVSELVASDVDASIIDVAKSNLSLLSPAGLERRREQIESDYREFGKASHLEALASVDRLSELHTEHEIHTTCMQRDITSEAGWTSNMNAVSNVGGVSAVSDVSDVSDVNIVMTDLPYGNVVSWRSDSADPLKAMLDNIRPMLDSKSSIVALIADKKQKLQHSDYERVQHFKLGKRQIAFFQPC